MIIDTSGRTEPSLLIDRSALHLSRLSRLSRMHRRSVPPVHSACGKGGHVGAIEGRYGHTNTLRRRPRGTPHQLPKLTVRVRFSSPAPAVAPGQWPLHRPHSEWRGARDARPECRAHHHKAHWRLIGISGAAPRARLRVRSRRAANPRRMRRSGTGRRSPSTARSRHGWQHGSPVARRCSVDRPPVQNPHSARRATQSPSVMGWYYRSIAPMAGQRSRAARSAPCAFQSLPEVGIMT